MKCCSLSLAIAGLLCASDPPAQATSSLSASAIANKNVAARGGLEAWRSVRTMTMQGKLGAGGNRRATLAVPNPAPSGKKEKDDLTVRPVDEVYLPFLMEVMRPRKMRFELQFKGQTAVQVFDGVNGWKLRPYLGRRVVEPYTSDEMKIASAQADLDGPLIDYAAKGTRVALAGIEKVENRDTYKLQLTMKNGEWIHVWIDSETFLEAKIQGQPRRLDGVEHPVEVYFRDYRTVSGLRIPFLLETRVLPVAEPKLRLRDPLIPPEKAIIDAVVVNPKLDEGLFSKPEVQVASK